MKITKKKSDFCHYVVFKHNLQHVSNVPGCTVRDFYQHVFCILQVRCKNNVEVLKAYTELLDLCSSTYSTMQIFVLAQ